MTFLELVNRLKQENGVSGPAYTTLAGISREGQRLKDWIATAWSELQGERPDWLWMKTPFSFQTIDGKQSYSPADMSLPRFNRLQKDSCRIYRTTDGPAGELFLKHTGYPEFRDFYLFGSLRIIKAHPTAITVDPQKNVLLGFTPDDTYTVNGEYYPKPQILSADTDTPEMPEEYHLSIVYFAMQTYGLFESAQEQLVAGKIGGGKLLSRLRLEQTPSIGIGGGFL